MVASRPLRFALAWALIASTIAVARRVGAAENARTPWVVVQTGNWARKDTPVHAAVPLDLLGPGAAKVLAAGPGAVVLVETSAGASGRILAQVEHIPGTAPEANMGRLTFLLPGETPANTSRRFRMDPSTLTATNSPWAFSDPATGALDLSNAGRPVFRYNLTPVANASFPAILTRDAYLHPVHTPSGALITGDFSPHHPHHRGLFLAYTRTEVGTIHPDFWNIQNGTGKIVFDRLDAAVAGPLTARVATRHRWDAKGAGTVLNERWEIEAYDVPGAPYWLFDLTTTQQAVREPLVLLPYRYGGMAYRGPEPFVKGTLDVLTSEGLNRTQGDQKPARWVDLTGPVAEGTDRYGGVAILDHPKNPGHPTVARIHPTTLPFFTYTPGHDVRVTISASTSTVFRYRVVVHDGHPNATRDERLWHDFADPPSVTVEPGGP